MAKQELKFTSILGGQSPSKYFASEGQYNSGIAIDPDYPIGSEIKTSGAIVPTRYEKFSSTGIDSWPLWLTTTTKNTNIYAYQFNGKFVSYSSSLGSETSIGTPTGGAGNGMAYYNNYIYLATPTDISRYGPLNNSPTLTNTAWTGAALGTQTALTNTTYPAFRSVTLPNHSMHVHSDLTMYVCDYKNGIGMIHRVSTKKVTDEGDTNDTTVPSAYNVLDFPYGYYPTDIESYGTDLVISCVQTTDSTVMQGKSAIFFWDTVSSSFYRKVDISNPLVTALLNVNGILYIFSGNAQKGVSIEVYAGGDSAEQIAFLEEGNPPFPGAVEAMANRIYFGTWTSEPETAAVVFSLGSKNKALPQGFHCSIKTTSAGATPITTAIRHVLQADNSAPQLIVGFGDSVAKELNKPSTTATYASRIRFPWQPIGKKFKIEKIQIPLARAVAANMSIIPKIYIDDDLSSPTTLATISTTLYDGKRNIVYKQPNLTINPEHNFMLELNFAGTVVLPVIFPLSILLDIQDDE